MMRKILAVLFAGTLTLTLWNNANAQGGRVILDFYYGFPNLWSGAAERFIERDFNVSGLDFSTSGPMGGRAEVLVTQRIGIGVDVMFANSGVDFQATRPDQNGEGGTDTYNYSVSVKRPRVLGRLNFHLLKSRIFDPYFAIGVGYNGTKADVTTDDPLFTNLSLPFSLPIAARAGFGMRLMVFKYVGISAEVGLGGPLVTGGVSIRI